MDVWRTFNLKKKKKFCFYQKKDAASAAQFLNPAFEFKVFWAPEVFCRWVLKVGFMLWHHPDTLEGNLSKGVCPSSIRTVCKRTVCPKTVSYSRKAHYGFEELWISIYLFMRWKSVSAVGDGRIAAHTKTTRKRMASIREAGTPLVLSYSRAAAI